MIDFSKVLRIRYPGCWLMDGESYEGITWVSQVIPKPTLAELEAAWAEIQNPPVVVTVANFRLALGRVLLAELLSAIANITDPDIRFEIETLLEYRPTISRAHPRVAQMAAMMNKTNAEVDAIFATAKQLDNALNVS
jgi:hypothetical protein